METPLLATLVRRVHLAIRRQVNDDLHAAGYGDLTPAHIYVFQSPGPEGARPTELAARTNMTKQAMNHLLVKLEHLGYIERTIAPDDGRGTVLHLTARGREAERLVHERAAALERMWVGKLGRKRVEELRQLLADLDAVESSH